MPTYFVSHRFESMIGEILLKTAHNSASYQVFQSSSRDQDKYLDYTVYFSHLVGNKKIAAAEMHRIIITFIVVVVVIIIII